MTVARCRLIDNDGNDDDVAMQCCSWYCVVVRCMIYCYRIFVNDVCLTTTRCDAARLFADVNVYDDAGGASTGGDNDGQVSRGTVSQLRSGQLLSMTRVRIAGWGLSLYDDDGVWCTVEGSDDKVRRQGHG